MDPKTAAAALAYYNDTVKKIANNFSSWHETGIDCYQEGCEVKRNTIYKRCSLIDLIENVLLENRFTISNFKRRI